MSEKNINLIDKKDCTGCGLCSTICPKQCISMDCDAEGFLMPRIDSGACVNCGICLNKCPVNSNEQLLYADEYKYYCGAVKDEDRLIKSSSGGVFPELANYVLDMDGAVCGCVYDENVNPTHSIYFKGDNIEDMYGSKYVQSKAEHCFKEIKALLSDGKTVMFIGTACQVAALRNYLGKEYSNLYTVEILCHGVPSPGLFSKYVGYLEKKLHGKVLNVQFRNKERDGWGSEHRTCVVYLDKNGNKKKLRPILPAYFSAFFYGLDLRESCYNCRFARPERVADLTIGDFWGSWAKFGKRFNEGISVVGVNTQHGAELLGKIESGFKYLTELSRQEAFRSNDNFEHPVKRPKERDGVYGGLEKGYKGFWKKAYFTRTYRKKTLASIYGAFVPAKLRFWLHKIRTH